MGRIEEPFKPMPEKALEAAISTARIYMPKGESGMTTEMMLSWAILTLMNKNSNDLHAARLEGLKAGLEKAIAWHEGMMIAHKNNQQHHAAVSEHYKRHEDMWLHHRQSKTHLEAMQEHERVRAHSPETIAEGS
jgi:hypothetical protein